jgi:hypothetical protein
MEVAGHRVDEVNGHTDAEREWGYDVTPLGRFEKGLVEAKAEGWTVVDMKKNWKVIYPFEK